MKTTVLIVSSLSDVHARAVMTALAAHSCRVELLDLSEFPQQLALSMAFRNGLRQFRLDRVGGGSFDLSEVRAAWWRRPQPFKPPASLKNSSDHRLAFSESGTAFQGMYQSLDAFWINDPMRDQAASHKPWQLTVAQQVGLEIPETLMTNHPEAARAFWAACNGDAIYKQFLALPDSWSETRRVGQQEETLTENIRLCPVIFQKRIPATADLRVTIIGDEIFAASTACEEHDYDVDVRVNLAARYAAHKLPEDVERKLVALMRRLGLVYGAIDLRLTDDGRYVFLEVNPAGQFLYVENATGQPISAALAAHLAEGKSLAATAS
ncbi:MAG: MvdC/MvdD family ATP grasp protein [Candidatus Acidiferrales bacterium]